MRMLMMLVVCWPRPAAARSVSATAARHCAGATATTLHAYMVCILAGRGAGGGRAALLPHTEYDLTPVKATPPPKQNIFSQTIRNTGRLAILVPFRNCFEELLQFVPHMYQFLERQNVRFQIFVIQQSDNNRFNRAALINVGFLYVRRHFDYIAIHDIDLLPLNDNLLYWYPKLGPVHIASPEKHPDHIKYNFYMGGILLITTEHFQLVNGMSNIYWGWGIEDDEFYLRLKDAGLSVYRHNVTTGSKDTFKHVHDGARRWRDTRSCGRDQPRGQPRQRDSSSGLHNVNFRVRGLHHFDIDNMRVLVIDVQLICDTAVTPWCRCDTDT